MNDIIRPDWDEIWMSLAHTFALRSIDPTLKVGAVIVSYDNSRVLSLGYNGSVKGFPNERESMIPGQGGLIHAEQNALWKLNYHDPCYKKIYVTDSPCKDCAMGIVQCGINTVIFDKPYRDKAGIELLLKANVSVMRFFKESEKAIGTPDEASHLKQITNIHQHWAK